MAKKNYKNTIKNKTAFQHVWKIFSQVLIYASEKFYIYHYAETEAPRDGYPKLMSIC